MIRTKDKTNIRVIITKIEVIELKKYKKTITLVNDRYILPLEEDDYLPLGFILHLYIPTKRLTMDEGDTKFRRQWIEYKTGRIEKAYLEVGKNLYVKLKLKENTKELTAYTKHILYHRTLYKFNSVLADERIYLNKTQKNTSPNKKERNLKRILNYKPTYIPKKK